MVHEKWDTGVTNREFESELECCYRFCVWYVVRDYRAEDVCRLTFGSESLGE